MIASEILTPSLARKIASSRTRNSVAVLTWDESRTRSGRSGRGGRLNSALLLTSAAARQIAGLNPMITAGGAEPVTPFRSVDAAWHYLRVMHADPLTRGQVRQWLAWLEQRGIVSSAHTRV